MQQRANNLAAEHRDGLPLVSWNELLHGFLLPVSERWGAAPDRFSGGEDGVDEVC